MLCNFPWIKREKDGSQIVLPCGKCKGCKIAHSREWAFRLLCELDSYKGEGCFITLTYNDENIPENGSLRKKDYQDFFKRLRSYYTCIRIKYYLCGEYGDKFGRPHYHAIVFGLKTFPAEKFWSYGFVDIGSVTYDSCRYVAGYIDKKYSQRKNKELYTDHGLIPPFQSQSQGLGLDYALKHSDQIKNGITIRGSHLNIPRYFITKGIVPDSSVSGTENFFHFSNEYKKEHDLSNSEFFIKLEAQGRQKEQSMQCRNSVK